VKFDFVVNLNTAAALGLTMRPAHLGDLVSDLAVIPNDRNPGGGNRGFFNGRSGQGRTRLHRPPLQTGAASVPFRNIG
jgi:hypothetical protein